MVIADLRVQLDEARGQLGEKEELVAQLKEQLATEQLALANTHQREDENQVNASRLVQLYADLQKELVSYQALRDALQAIVGTSSKGAPAINEDALVERVLARLGAARVIQMAPIEALKYQFQRDAVERLIAQVQALEERPKQAIMWLLSVNRPAKHMEICKRLAFPEAGASFAKFGTGIKKAVAAGFLTTDADGLHVAIRAKVATELEPYGPSPEEVEATYQHLVGVLAERAHDER